MFPNKVYHCSCVSFTVKLCLVDGNYSFESIIKRLLKEKLKEKIFTVKCGYANEDVVFSCRRHMNFKTVCEDYHGSNSCKKCLRSFLQTMYVRYDYTNFDLPLSVKKNNKTLCLFVKKL